MKLLYIYCKLLYGKSALILRGNLLILIKSFEEVSSFAYSCIKVYVLPYCEY